MTYLFLYIILIRISMVNTCIILFVAHDGMFSFHISGLAIFILMLRFSSHLKLYENLETAA